MEGSGTDAPTRNGLTEGVGREEEAGWLAQQLLGVAVQRLAIGRETSWPPNCAGLAGYRVINSNSYRRDALGF